MNEKRSTYKTCSTIFSKVSFTGVRGAEIIYAAGPWMR